jgi:hypothetical protein
MKKLWIGIFLFVLYFITHLSLGWAQQASGPRMVIKEKSVDYKEVNAGKKIEHVFKVLNQGDQPLVIQKVRPG